MLGVVIIVVALLLVAAVVVWTLIRLTDWILKRVSTQYPGVVFRVDADERAMCRSVSSNQEEPG